MIDDAMKVRLTRLYAGSQVGSRLGRVQKMLEFAWRFRRSAYDFEAVEAAIWFHDAVRGGEEGDGKRQSAALASGWLAGYAADERVDFVVRAVLATGTHEVPVLKDWRLMDDVGMVLDADLHYLGASWQDCRADDDRDWARNRHAALERVAARPTVYLTAEIRELHEGRARDNLGRLLEIHRSLAPRPDTAAGRSHLPPQALAPASVGVS